MLTQQQTAEFSSETVRNVVGTLIWLARSPKQSGTLSRNWLVHLPKNRNRDELQSAIKVLTESFHKRYDAIIEVCTAFQERLQKAAEDFPPGREMDPDDIAVPELEKSEEYFRKEREELNWRCSGRLAANRRIRSIWSRGLRSIGTPGQAV